MRTHGRRTISSADAEVSGMGATMQTTTLGSYPKPDYLDLPDWFKKGTATQDPTTGYLEAVERLGAHSEELFIRAARDVIRDQVEVGVDVVTDGEVRREDYIHYHCRHLEGLDFDRLTEKPHRAGAFTSMLPTWSGRSHRARLSAP